MTDIGAELRRRLLALPPSSQPLVGATDEDIRELEAYAGGELPEVYRQFLRHLGRGAGVLLRGTHHALGRPFDLRLREYAEDLLRRNGTPFQLSPSAFVFLMSQGGQFTYFLRDESNDPAVYTYLEGEPQPTRLDDTLSGYLRRCVEACERRTTVTQPV